MIKTNETKKYTHDNMDEHYLVIIDNMVGDKLPRQTPIYFWIRDGGFNSLADMVRVDESGYALPCNRPHR